MSKLARRPIQVPEGMKISLSGDLLNFSYKGCDRSVHVNKCVDIKSEDSKLFAVPADGYSSESKSVKQNLGTAFRSILSTISDMSSGSGSGNYSRKIKAECVGSRCFISDGYMVLFLGYSHFSGLKIPQGISVKSEQKDITISGFKDDVCKFADKIRYMRRWDPCARRGVYFSSEKVRVKKCKKG